MDSETASRLASELQLVSNVSGLSAFGPPGGAIDDFPLKWVKTEYGNDFLNSEKDHSGKLFISIIIVMKNKFDNVKNTTSIDVERY